MGRPCATSRQCGQQRPDLYTALQQDRLGQPSYLFHHVALRVVENLEDETTVELHLVAPEGLSGTVVVDLGLVEV